MAEPDLPTGFDGTAPGALTATSGAAAAPSSFDGADLSGAIDRHRGVWLVAATLGLAYGAAAMLSIALSREFGSVANVWYANALAVVVLLHQPQSRWPVLLLAASLANVAAKRWWGDDWAMIAVLLLPNVLELALTAWLLRRAALPAQPLRAPMPLLRLLLFGAVVPQAVAACLASALLALRGAPQPWLMGLTWLEGGTIGAVSVLPLGLAIATRPLAGLAAIASDLRAVLMLPVAVGLALVCLATMPYPFVYVLLPLLVAAMLLDVAAVAMLTLSVSLTIAVALGTGVLLPPPVTAEWQMGLVYLAVAATLVPALLLSSTVAAWRDEHGRLQQRTAQLEQAHTSLRQFVHAASHDLREPLNAIAQFNDLLQADHAAQLPAHARGWLALVGDEAARMRVVLDDVLQYAQVQRLEVVTSEPVALDSVLNEVLAALPPSQRDCVHVAPLPVVSGQAALLVLLFTHLVANALKFVPAGETPQVRVRATVHDGWATVVVADRGIGMAEDDLPRLFTPFQRLHRRSAYPGTGLGLAICRQVAVAHGGSIWLRSKPGQGTRALVRLPLQSQ